MGSIQKRHKQESCDDNVTTLFTTVFLMVNIQSECMVKYKTLNLNLWLASS